MKLRADILKDSSWGQFSTAMFMICVASGVFIAITYDVKDPYASLSTLMIANPAASFFRNLHYWSAQLFLVFSFIHIYDHVRKKEGIRLKKAVWARLSIGVLIILLAMLTGFLLKADADSIQAGRILDSLISSIPLAGNLLSWSLLGNEENYQLIYVHHIATFTIFLAIIIFEHSRKIWPKWKEFTISLLLISIPGFFVSAPLHDNLNPTVKGPWYFLGLQEILHWLTIPSLSLLIVLLLIILIFMVPYGNPGRVFFTKRALLILTIAYLILTITGLFFRGPNWSWVWPGEDGYSYRVLPQMRWSSLSLAKRFDPVQVSNSSLIDGRRESCVVCHTGMSGFADAHNPLAIGCYNCHGGHPFESEKQKAHEDMLLIPGNLADASRSCGTANCHPEITSRIHTGLMANLSGMISVDRFTFGEQDSPDLLTSVHDLGDSPADEHLRNLCVVCHLGNPKTETGPSLESSRGGGCIACHLDYSETTLKHHEIHKQNADDTTYLAFHPAINLKVSNDHCFGCHSRSGRISTNYEGWHETTLQAGPQYDSNLFRIVENTRVFRKIEEDVHHSLGMECIDCHNSYELMGDGNYYAHEEEMVTIRCEDCHFHGEPKLTDRQSLDQESAIIASLRFSHDPEMKFLTTALRDKPLINTYYKDDTAFLRTKNLGKLFAMKPPAEVCTRGDAHDRLSCSSCHTSWAPSCIGCHNNFDGEEAGYDMVARREKTGTWVEYIGEYNAHPPALGVRSLKDTSTIIPVIPGMILTIDMGSYNKKLHDSLIFRRMYAPSAPHTTRKKGRDCKSCHNDPVALGYGQGTLTYSIDGGEGRWIFSSTYAENPNDKLPEDAWIGFLTDRDGMVSTRTDVRPFSSEEQRRILTAGACLTCHEETSGVMTESLDDFESLLKKRSDKCVVPTW